jgi:hypothetical protein
MKTNPPVESKKPGFVIRVHLTDGSVSVYPGVPQIPADSWLAEPVFNEARG